MKESGRQKTDLEKETGILGYKLRPKQTRLLWELVRESRMFLFQQHLNLNARNKDGMTALMIAAKEGVTAIAHDLLRKGAYINIADDKGETPLIHAVKGEEGRS